MIESARTPEGYDGKKICDVYRALPPELAAEYGFVLEHDEGETQDGVEHRSAAVRNRRSASTAGAGGFSTRRPTAAGSGANTAGPAERILPPAGEAQSTAGAGLPDGPRGFHHSELRIFHIVPHSRRTSP